MDQRRLWERSTVEGAWYFDRVAWGLLDVQKVQRALALLLQVEQQNLALALHCHRVAGLAVHLGHRLGVGEDQLQTIRWAALLHDIGKLQIPDAILDKRGPLSNEEWDIVYRHPSEGADLVRSRTGLYEVAVLIGAHHERYNANGYPSHLHGDRIPLGARILAVADAYCAMTDERVYRKILTPQEARMEVLRCAGTDFDPIVVNAFFGLF